MYLRRLSIGEPILSKLEEWVFYFLIEKYRAISAGGALHIESEFERLMGV